MRRYALPVILFVVLTVVVSGWLVTRRAGVQGDETARAQDGLRGEVKSVRVETFPVVSRSGEWTEAAGSLESETLYTPQGNLSEVSRYRPDGGLEYRLVHRYENGRLTEETSFGDGDQPLYSWFYVYDGEGRLTSLSGYDDRGVLEVKTLYGYDAEGRLATETSYSADETLSYEARQSYAQGYTRSTVYFAQGEAESRLEEVFDTAAHRLAEASYSPTRTLQYRVEYAYTPRGDLLTESAYSADETLEYRLENRYDEAGLLLETTEYDADLEPFYRYSYTYNDKGDLTKRESRGVDGGGSTLAYTYTYDKHDNWTVRRTSKPVTRSDKESLEPSEVARRTVSYY